MLAPVGAVSFSEALRWGAETYHALHALLKERGLATGLGDEGGFAPNLPSNEEACKLLLVAIERAGYRPGEEIALALDTASSEFYRQKASTCSTAKAGSSRVPSSPTISRILRRATRSCRSRTAWPRTTGKAGRSSPRRSGVACSSSATTCSSPIPSAFGRGIELGVANSILVKVNQIGTLSETLDTVQLASRAGYTSVMSHRSGETEDATIADLAVATNCGQIKTGAPARSDRVAKYNQLLRIEERLGDTAAYLGRVPSPGGHDDEALGLPGTGRVDRARTRSDSVRLRVPDPLVPRAAAPGERRRARCRGAAGAEQEAPDRSRGSAVAGRDRTHRAGAVQHGLPGRTGVQGTAGARGVDDDHAP